MSKSIVHIPSTNVQIKAIDVHPPARTDLQNVPPASFSVNYIEIEMWYNEATGTVERWSE